MSCTITQNLEIVPGTRADYETLSHYHYRESHVGSAIGCADGETSPAAMRRGGPYAAVFALKGKFRTATKIETVGVIVYAMPVSGCRMRSEATPIFSGLDKSTRLKLINKNIRTISRVIIEPRFRSLGLAARLVKETMPLMNTPFVEALAVMGRVNPFFEKAGMTRFDAPPSVGCVRLIEAFGATGIDEQDLIDLRLVQQKLDAMLDARSSMLDFIEHEMTRFLQGYGQRRLMKPGIERTRFIVSKLTDRPVYYLWKNQNVELRV
ncbi:MAG: hypothetical protein ABII09_04385 [Planctomycetota bacterium]